MLLKVQDKQGNVYTMSSDTPKCILELHYSTSYYQFVVQDYTIDDYGSKTYPKKDIIVPLDDRNWVDFIAVDPEEIGSIIDK